MLNELQPDMRELLDLVRQAENFDATLAASRQVDKPIEPAPEAYAERERRGVRIAYLRNKWGI